MSNLLLNTTRWMIPTPTEVLKDIKTRNKRERVNFWFNDGSLSPLELFCYLKCRFGEPNGLTMTSKRPGTDNIIHWHYTFKEADLLIHFFGTNASLQIVISNYSKTITDTNWRIIVELIKDDFKNYGQQMGQVRKSLEKWSLFVNPYKRLDVIINRLVSKVDGLTLQKPTPLSMVNTEESRARYFNDYDQWLGKMLEAQVTGTCIRMLSPVYGEAFINLLIFVLAKDEVKQDRRLYDDLIRRQIDIRIKSLHLHCVGFIKKIDHTAQEFKDFHTLMNSRNDFLHGNIDPYKLKFDEVFFDASIPLFRDEDSLLNRLAMSSIKFIDPNSAQHDVKTVKNFIMFVLSHLEESFRKKLEIIMEDTRPGWNENTKTLGTLFSQRIVEFLPSLF